MGLPNKDGYDTAKGNGAAIETSGAGSGSKDARADGSNGKKCKYNIFIELIACIFWQKPRRILCVRY